MSASSSREARSSHDATFVLGVALGTAAGFVLGSIVAWRFGDEGVDAIRRLVERFLDHDSGPKFEYLLQ